MTQFHSFQNMGFIFSFTICMLCYTFSPLRLWSKIAQSQQQNLKHFIYIYMHEYNLRQEKRVLLLLLKTDRLIDLKTN